MTASSSFGRPELDAFLSSCVGEDGSGVELTVLSALTRLGFDPWQEAARLSELPRETAARTLASAFARLPEGDCKISPMSDLAARLVDCLPRPGTSPVSVIANRHPAERAASRSTRWLFWLAVAVGWFFLMSYLTTNPVYESTATVSAPN